MSKKYKNFKYLHGLFLALFVASIGDKAQLVLKIHLKRPLDTQYYWWMILKVSTGSQHDQHDHKWTNWLINNTMSRLVYVYNNNKFCVSRNRLIYISNFFHNILAFNRKRLFNKIIRNHSSEMANTIKTAFT